VNSAARCTAAVVASSPSSAPALRAAFGTSAQHTAAVMATSAAPDVASQRSPAAAARPTPRIAAAASDQRPIGSPASPSRRQVREDLAVHPEGQAGAGKRRGGGPQPWGPCVQDQSPGIEPRRDGEDAGEAEDLRQGCADDRGTGSHRQEAGNIEGDVDVLPVLFLLPGSPVRGGLVRNSGACGLGCGLEPEPFVPCVPDRRYRMAGAGTAGPLPGCRLYCSPDVLLDLPMDRGCQRGRLVRPGWRMGSSGNGRDGLLRQLTGGLAIPPPLEVTRPETGRECPVLTASRRRRSRPLPLRMPIRNAPANSKRTRSVGTVVGIAGSFMSPAVRTRPASITPMTR
jgi:hypothetical protein